MSPNRPNLTFRFKGSPSVNTYLIDKEKIEYPLIFS